MSSKSGAEDLRGRAQRLLCQLATGARDSRIALRYMSTNPFVLLAKLDVIGRIYSYCDKELNNNVIYCYIVENIVKFVILYLKKEIYLMTRSYLLVVIPCVDFSFLCCSGQSWRFWATFFVNTGTAAPETKKRTINPCSLEVKGTGDRIKSSETSEYPAKLILTPVTT